MTSFKCPTCDKVFTRKAALNYHLNNKVCKRDLNDDQFDENDENKDEKNINMCKICFKKFTTATSMYRHMNHTCKMKKREEDMKREIYEKLVKTELQNVQTKMQHKMQKEIETLKEEVKLLKTTKHGTTITGCTNNINNGTVNTTNNTNNIILVGYGKEDISKLDKSDMLKVLQNGYHSTIKLTEAVHFNPKYPEYHNIYISNMKDKYAMMFDGKNWTLTTKEDLINKIYDDKKNYIEENLEEFVDSLPPSRKRALHRWLETDDDDQKIKEIKESIKLLLYNSRKLVCDTVPIQKNSILVKKSKSIKAYKDG